MAYRRREVTDGVTIMNKDLYDNLQDGVDESKKELSTLGGTVEIGSEVPTKEKTVLTINPNGEEVNIYTAEEIDEMIRELGQNPSVDLSGYAKKTDIPTNEKLGNGYAVGSSEGSPPYHGVTIEGYELVKGGIVSIKFAKDVIEDSYLSINNSDYIPIYHKGTIIADNVIKSGDTATFIYDGSCYHLISVDSYKEDIVELRSDINDLRETFANIEDLLTDGNEVRY